MAGVSPAVPPYRGLARLTVTFTRITQALPSRSPAGLRSRIRALAPSFEPPREALSETGDIADADKTRTGRACRPVPAPSAGCGRLPAAAGATQGSGGRSCRDGHAT